jgi:hypothetical protein
MQNQSSSELAAASSPSPTTNDNDNDNENHAPPSSSSSSSSNSGSYTLEDLIDLIRAVKFTNPEASIRSVHKEITTVMSNNAGFEFLSHVKLDQVKKVWKKALKKSSNPPVAASTSSGATAATATTKNHTNAHHHHDEDDPTRDLLVTDQNVLRMPKDGILKFYTVGNPSSSASSVQSLAEGYTLEAAARVAQEEAVKEQTRREELEKYVHCFWMSRQIRVGRSLIRH